MLMMNSPQSANIPVANSYLSPYLITFVAYLCTKVPYLKSLDTGLPVFRREAQIVQATSRQPHFSKLA